MKPAIVKRLLVSSILLATATVAVALVLGSQLAPLKFLKVEALGTREEKIRTYVQNLSDTSRFVRIPYRGSSEEQSFTWTMGRALVMAPDSIDYALQVLDHLPPLDRLNFPRLLCAGATSEQIDEYCGRIRFGRVGTNEVIQFSNALLYCRKRGMSIKVTWIDCLIDRTWSDEDCHQLSFYLRELVDYPGWPGVQEEWPEGKGLRVWTGFRAWWLENRPNVVGAPGRRIELGKRP